ncbi:PREDICTED: uncharacterized protein LOC107188223 [Dufourea novaeangliae]|uniref:Uncharacterized protein n=1 Tax=Dufourea novaeangliae TaxID=178035 RepID=A0A154PE91_DUFNO|nr:PREDICTED: uncharacterized protein LOC107188223 [Dufourea novaeangliae]KZC10182.1 hypothetical protein WN55_01165 [Dufourea novaeangliae]
MTGNHGVVTIVAIIVATVNGRVYYTQNTDGNRYGVLTYPVPNEQSSRDLDLSFSAGDANEIDDTIRPVKKVYTLANLEKPFAEVNRDEAPIARYRLVEAPVKRLAGSDDVIVLPEQSRKTVKIDGNNKGEVILELRVIANHDST